MIITFNKTKISRADFKSIPNTPTGSINKPYGGLWGSTFKEIRTSDGKTYHSQWERWSVSQKFNLYALGCGVVYSLKPSAKILTIMNYDAVDESSIKIWNNPNKDNLQAISEASSLNRVFERLFFGGASNGR